MSNKTTFIIIISICLISIYITSKKCELFNSDTNLFFQPISNIFLSDNYYNYNFNRPDIKTNTKSLSDITFNSYLYSKPISKKIICSSYKNRGDCWEDNVNNCQWVYKIDNGSYCDVGSNIWP